MLVLVVCCAGGWGECGLSRGQWVVFKCLDSFDRDAMTQWTIKGDDRKFSGALSNRNFMFMSTLPASTSAARQFFFDKIGHSPKLSVGLRFSDANFLRGEILLFSPF